MPFQTPEEIIVRGRKPQQSRGGLPGPVGPSPGRKGPGGVSPLLGFVAPAVAPAIEEIIVTAPRPTAPPPASAVPAYLRGLSGAALIGGVLGLTARAILDELGQQLLDKEFAELMAERQKAIDTPVIVTQPAPIPEIVVTAKRPFPQVAPQPIFFPDRFDSPDPFIMQPIIPREMPARPDVEVAPGIATPTAPEIAPTLPAVAPAVAPAVVPRPAVSPATRVAPLTIPLPFAQPAIRTSPKTTPRTLTSSQPRVATSNRLRSQTRSLARAQAFAQAQEGQKAGRCPPCKKDEKRDEPRTECFKKLVKEALLPEFDESYNWVEIDCLTGREL